MKVKLNKKIVVIVLLILLVGGGTITTAHYAINKNEKIEQEASSTKVEKKKESKTDKTKDSKVKAEEENNSETSETSKEEVTTEEAPKENTQVAAPTTNKPNTTAQTQQNSAQAKPAEQKPTAQKPAQTQPAKAQPAQPTQTQPAQTTQPAQPAPAPVPEKPSGYDNALTGEINRNFALSTYNGSNASLYQSLVNSMSSGSVSPASVKAQVSGEFAEGGITYQPRDIQAYTFTSANGDSTEIFNKIRSYGIPSSTEWRRASIYYNANSKVYTVAVLGLGYNKATGWQ